ncbi:unnamed protein product [Timema podura]
MTCI